MSKINEGFKQIISGVVKMLLHSIVQVDKDEAKFPVSCHLVAREFNIKGQQLIFHLSFIHIVQLSEGNCTLWQICWAVVL